MGLFDISGQDKEVVRGMLNEAFALWGTNARLMQVTADNKDFNNDNDYQRLPYQEINLLYEEFPKPTLRKLGWFQEDQEMPAVAYVLPLDKDGNRVRLREGSVIEIPYNEVRDGVRTMFVGRCQADSLNFLYWICTLTPNRIQVIKDAEGKDIEEVNPVGDTLLNRGGGKDGYGSSCP